MEYEWVWAKRETFSVCTPFLRSLIVCFVSYMNVDLRLSQGGFHSALFKCDTLDVSLLQTSFVNVKYD